MAVVIDAATPFGERALKRLDEDLVAWLTTSGKDGAPHPRPVWFLWDGESILIYSRPETAKLAHIARNPRVALNLNSDRYGDDVVILNGSASVDESAPAANEIPAYVEKYGEGIASIGMTPESFAAEYRVPIRVTLQKVSGH